MNDNTIIWTWIREFMISNNYMTDETKILLSFPVGTSLPKETDFIIITKMDQQTKGLPIQTFKIINRTEKVQQMQIDNWQETRWQVDFYGAKAYINSQAFYAYLLSASGSDALQLNGMGITSTEIVQQLTAEFDREVYISRYISRFNTHYINSISIKQPSIDQTDININYVQVI